jgi:membrane associated rhomboid family serine protease
MNEPIALCNLLLIAATGLVSYLGFRSREFEEKYIFHPERILAGKEYYRLVTSAFLHANWRHLGLNMLSLYLFGGPVEFFVGKAQFLLIYFGAVIGGDLLSLFVHRHHEYRSYGASGGVCGIIFAYLLLFPGSSIGMYYLPVHVPGWLYAICYLLASFYGMKEHRDNVGHDAHLGGAIIGLLVAAVLNPTSVRYNLPVFLVVLSVSIVLLVFLWLNPLFLPATAFFGELKWKGRSSPNLPKHKKESLQVDAILEKISQHGKESLTEEETALLGEVSGKYQRRATSKKPDSGLAI